MMLPDHYPQFFTATILEWKHLLKPGKYKELIASSLHFLILDKRIVVYGFVFMSNPAFAGRQAHSPCLANTART